MNGNVGVQAQGMGMTRASCTVLVGVLTIFCCISSRDISHIQWGLDSLTGLLLVGGLTLLLLGLVLLFSDHLIAHSCYHVTMLKIKIIICIC